MILGQRGRGGDRDRDRDMDRDRAKRAEDVNHVMMMRFMRLMRERVPSTVNEDAFGFGSDAFV